jgi:DMSO/TMAO reductase YedYZ molybdopterin-dependent catalytic subunit
LTISGSQVAEPVKLSLNDMQDMGLQTFTFTGRNKLYDNARQTFEITGVTLADLLAAAGASSDATSLKVICSDGYVKVYDLQRLLADAYSYSYSDEGELVPAVIAIQENGAYYDGGEGNPFRLIMGQADWDNDETKDFNMQNWAKNLKEIVID